VSKKILIVLILILTAAGMLECGEAATTATTVNGTVTAPASTPATHFKVGQQVKVADTWVITVNSVKTTNHGLNEFDTPKSSNIFLVIDVIQKNISSQQQTVNATFDWTLRDSTGQSYNQTLASNGPDGNVEINAQVHGQFSFEVPKTEKTFTLAFSPGLGDNQVIWDLAV
jgi:hypothetical protein